MSDKATPATTAAPTSAQRVSSPAALAAAEAAAAGASSQAPVASGAGLAAAVLPGGQVLAVEGSAWLQVPGQVPQPLSAGAAVPPGAVMLAAADAVVRLSRPQSVGAKAAAKGGLDKLIADFDKGVGDTATAAGVAGGDETTAEGGLRVDRVSEATTTAGLGTNGSGGSGSGTGAEFPTAGTAGGTPDGTTPTTPPNIVLDNPGLTGDATPRISGSTDLAPGSLVSVTVTDANGQVQVITATVGSDGRFAVDTAPLPDGNFSVNVQAENTTVTTGGTVDTTPPTLRLDPVAITGDNTPAISGQSNLPSGSTVKVTVVDAAGKSQELTATIGSDGRFSVSPGQNLSDGRYTVQVVATDAAGNAQTNTTTGVVDTKAPAVSVDAPDLSNSTQPTVSGRTDLPGGTPIDVKITDANGQTQTTQATVRPDGSFSLTPSTPLPDGNFTVEVTGRDAAGNPSTSTSTGTVDSTAPLSPSIGSVVDDHGPIQGKLNPGGATDDSRPTFNGTAEPGSTVTVYTNGVPIGTTPVAPNGTWSFTPEVPLPAGPNSITTTATDPAGNTGPSSQPFALTVDVGAPQVPSIISATDNITPVEGLLTKGSGTNDNTPTINGYGRPGETVTLFADGQPVGSVVVNAKGEWSITPSALADKTWNFTAEAVNIHGVHSPVTGAWPLTIDTQAPRQVAVDTVTDNAGPVRGEITEGSTTDDATPTWQGKNAEPGSTITVYDKGAALGSTTVGADGTWRFTPPVALPDGPHSLTITATDAVGNVSPATPPLNFSIDTSVVTSPTIDSVTEAGATGEVPMAFNQASKDTTPTLSGSSKPNQVVQVFDGETLLGETRADASGQWSFTPSTPLPDGPHDFVAVSLNAAGVPSEPSNAFRVVVDTVAPDAPPSLLISDDVGRVQGPLQSGDSTDDNTPTFSGSGANPGDTITVLDGGQPVGTAVVKPNGTWSLTPLTPLTPGAHEFTLTATDPAGNTSAPSAPFALTIDIAPPDAPTIGGIFDNTGAVVGEIAPGATTDDAKPTIWGSAEPGSTVEVFDGDTLLGRATTGPDGYWTFTPTLPLLLGEHEISARAVDEAGNTSAPSAPRDFNLMDDAPPSAPAIVNIIDDQGTVQGHVAKSTGITDDTQPSIRGTAEPGAVITVRDGSTVLGTTTTDSSGRWAFTPATPLADGPHAITVTATNAAGNVSAATGVYDFVVDTQNPDAPNSVIALDNVGPVVGAISNGQTTDDATPSLSGTGEPGATVTIYDGEVPIGTAVVKPDGTWQFTPTTPLLDGEHSLSTTQTDVAGNTSPASAPTTFTLDTKDVTAPTITALRDDVGTVQGAVQPDGVTDDTRPTLQGTAPAGTTVSVYDGTTLLGTVPADSAGRWSFTPSTPLADGPHVLSATATNAAGVVSPATAPYAVTVDTQGPAAPVITSLGDDVGSVQGALDEGARTDDTTPTLSGTGEPGATIKVYDGNDLIGTTTVDPDGRWTLTPATPLTEGPHSLTATATDPAGNTGPATPAQSLVVDLTATAAPTLTIAEDANDNGVVNLAELSGKVDITIGLPAGARVGDVLNLSTTTGNQTLTISAEQLAAGRVLTQVDAPASGEALIARVTLTDEAGNTSASAGDAAEFDYKTPDASTTALVINPITADNIVNAAEAGQSLQVTGQAQGEFTTGDTVTLSINGKSFSGIVAQDGSFSIAVPGADLAADPDHSVAGSLRATDPAGNQADIAASRVFSVDTSATGAPTVTLMEDANNDGFINRAELNGLVNVKVDLPQGAAVGDRIDVSNGEVTNSIVLTAQDLATGHVLTGFVAPPTGSTVAITATLTDVAGNSSPQGSDSARVDTTGPSSATTGISINPLTADNVINAAEAGGTVNVTGQATGEFTPGDVVTLSANGKTFTGTLGADGSFSVAVPGTDLAADGDKTLDVSVRITDPAGNQANITATRPYGVDTAATGAPTVTIAEDANNNGFISRAELNGVIDVRVDLPAGSVAGDTLTVSNGSTTSSFTLTAAQVSAGFVNTSFAAPAEGQVVNVTAILTDIAGNASPQGADAARIDTTGPSGGPGGTTGLVLDSLSADNVINAAEAGDTVRVTGHATGEFTAGDTVTLDINGQSFSGQVAADGSFSIPVPGAELAVDPDKTVQASLRATDPAGNQTDIPASRAYGVDISATGAPTVAIAEDANNNGFINRAELNGVVDVRVGLPAGTVAGDTLTVSNGSSTASFVVTAAHLAAGHIDTSFAAPADGQMVNITAILTDIAGNASPQGTDAARIDTTGPSSATTGITVNPVSADNIVNAAEAAGPVNVTGQATGEFTPGDVVTITANGKPFTGTLGADGSFTVAVPGADLVADGDKTLNVSIRITDPAGNQADVPATRAYSVDTAATGAPTVTIAEDANNNGFISRAELNGVVDVRVGLPAGTVAGDTLTVSNGTTTTPIVVTAAHLAAGHIDTSFAAPADGQTVNITAILTDIAGNASPQGTDAARIDTTGPSSATTGITVNPVSADNIVNAAEAAGPVNVTGQATGEFTPGDVVTITANGKPYTGTLGADGSFTVAVPGADLVADGDKTLDVSIRITDPAGNQADIPATRAYSVDTAATGAPTVTISEDANNNGFISRAELNGVVDVRVGLPAGTVAGDTLTVSNGTTTTSFTVSAAQAAAGFIDTSFAAPADGQTVNITAILTDIAGNASPQGTDAARIDTTGPSSATTGITVNPVSADNIVNAAEAAGPVNVTGQATGEFTPGDVVTITANGKPFTGTLGADGSFTVAVPGADLVADGDKTLNVSIRITDPAGNQADIPATRAYSVDTAATGAPTVTIAEDANNNGFISRAELNGVVDVRVGLPAGTVAGDTLTVSNGTTTTSFTVSAAQAAAGFIDTSFAAPADGQTVNITAILTDIAGNASPQGTDAARIDTTGPSSATTGITVNPVSADNIVNAAEAAGPVNVTGQATGEFTPGDVVTITANGKPFTGTLGADGSFTVAVPGADLVADGDKTLNVSIRITDPAGNQADIPATRVYSVDTAATGAPTVTIAEDANNNGFISRAELNGVVDVRVGLPAGTVAGDTLTVSNGTTTTPITVTAAHLAAGFVDTSFAAPADGQTVNITAILTDIAGNASPQGADAARIDTTGPSAAGTGLVLDALTADNVVNAAEAGGTVAVTGRATGEFTPGDTVTLTVNGKPFTGTVAANGSFSINVPGADLAADGDRTLDASLRATDAAGNQADIGASRLYSVDTTTTGAPTVTIGEDSNNNGFINRAELNGVIDVRVSLPAGAVAGDTLTVSNGTTTTPFTLTAAQVAAGFIDTSFAAPAEGSMINVTAVLTDMAGNSSPQGSDSARLDTTATAAPTVTIAEDINNNGFISSAELAGQVDVRITLPAGSAAGDTLTVTDGNMVRTFTLTAAQVSAGQILTDFPPPAEGQVLNVTATLRDMAGNTSAPGSDSAQLDTTGPSGAGTGVTLDPLTADNVINAAEAGGTVAVTGRATGEFAEGDRITLTVNGKTFTGTVAANGNFSVNVPGADLVADGDKTLDASLRATDAAGNQAEITASRPYTVDTTATGAPTVTITEDANNNAFISAAELSGDIGVRITLPAGAQLGDTLTVSDGTTTDRYVLNAAQLANGFIDTSFAAPAEGGTISVTATLTDVAGNTSAQGLDSARIDTTGPSGATTSISFANVTADNVVNAAESGGNVSVTGSVTGEFRQGDTITLTVNGKNFSGTLAANGSFSVAVPGSDLAADGDRRIEASLRATDAAGNQADISANKSYGVDTTAVATPTVTITDDSANDGWITPGEFNGALDVRVSLPGGTAVGDVVSVTNGQTWQHITVTQAHLNQGFVGTSFGMASSGSATAQAFITDVAGNRSGTGSDSVTFYDPLILDLDGDGVETMAISEGVNFDLNGDGVKDRTGWVGKDDGLLVADLDNSGTIDNGRELFGDATIKADGTQAKHGFEALADMDSNQDGKINAADANFNVLKIWQDGDSDGLTDTGELKSLTEMGVVEINLGYTTGNEKQSGNFITMESTYVKSDGTVLEISDVWLRNNSTAGATQGEEAGVVHISDFNPATGDALDLRDLLSGEQGMDLATYLDFDTTSQPGSTVVHVSTTGQFANGEYTPGASDQTIVLDGVDLRSAMGLGANSSDSQLIQTLLNQGKLLTDNGG